MARGNKKLLLVLDGFDETGPARRSVLQWLKAWLRTVVAAFAEGPHTLRDASKTPGAICSVATAWCSPAELRASIRWNLSLSKSS